MTDPRLSMPRRTVELPSERWADGVVVVRPPTGEPPVALNPTAMALWELCDGHTVVGEMVHAVATLFSLDPDRARVDVETALDDMRAAGVIR